MLRVRSALLRSVAHSHRSRATAAASVARVAHSSSPIASLAAAAASSSATLAARRCALHGCAARAFHSERAGSGWDGQRPPSSDGQQPQPQRQPSASESAWSDSRPFRERERESVREQSVDTSALTPAQMKEVQDREHDRATRRQARRNRARRKWETRADQFESIPREELPPPPPLYHPAPFASLPVIPDPKESLHSALIRVDKVPKSPGFGPEIRHVRGQMAKYNFIARRQLQTMGDELAGKLEARLAAFPRSEDPWQRERREQQQAVAAEARRAQGLEVGGDELQLFDSSTNGGDGDVDYSESNVQLHPFDQALLSCSIEGGGGAYNSLLNHCRNLVQRLRGAQRRGLQALNHSKSLDESRRVHRAAILEMKNLWAEGLAASDATGGSGQASGMQLVESLRVASRTLRHVPQLEFRRNLLDRVHQAASYLSVVPQELFLLPSEQLTFERLRPFLPPSPPYTLALVGAPNVGKSSLLTSLSNAKVATAPYAFTTRALSVGHLERSEEETPGWSARVAPASTAAASAQAELYAPATPLTRLQLVDTPGLLFRPDEMRKPAERMALAVCAHVQPLLLAFVTDDSGTGGMTRAMQRYLRREVRQRFSAHQPPHPHADENDPATHRRFDPAYANLSLSAPWQSLTRQLQRIPFLDLLSKSDVGKRQRVSEEVLRNGAATAGLERELHTIEQEIEMQANAEDAQQEMLEEDSATESSAQPAEISASDADSSDALVPSSASTRPSGLRQFPRAAWRLARLREHMQRYLTDPQTGRWQLDARPDEQLAPSDPTQLAAAATDSGDQLVPASNDWSSQSADPRPLCLSVSVQSGRGLNELVSTIWRLVDERESLRLQRDYLELRMRIEWVKGGISLGHDELQHMQRQMLPQQQASVQTIEEQP